jgi:hypothetical protein
VVDELVKLFLSPGGAAVFPKVIEDENRGTFHTFKEFIVGDLAFGAEGRAQVVEELRNDDEGDRLTFL